MGFKKLKNIIYNLTPKRVQDFYQAPLINRKLEVDPYLCHSYSQEGEDLILKRIFEGVENGFYVDVGAHHPKRFSNTFLFYQMGWRGLNIDATPGSMEEFNLIRPKDINLEFGIANSNEKLTYYIFNEPALNTFSLQEANKKNGLREFKIIEEIEVQTSKLSEVLDQFLAVDQRIDFLNIDVEGFDLSVLESLNWNRYRPTVILIEILCLNLGEVEKSEIFQFLTNKSYELIAKTFNTLIFKFKP